MLVKIIRRVLGLTRLERLGKKVVDRPGSGTVFITVSPQELDSVCGKRFSRI